MLHSQNLQEFTFGIFAAKIRLPYGKGLCPAWWLLGDVDKRNLTWATVGEIDILEMVGDYIYSKESDQYAYGTIHWILLILMIQLIQYGHFIENGLFI
jgi:beta-glucanase (GH16 family)